MGADQIQTNFTSGELDPRLRARVDVRHYFNGAARMRNVLVLPQGGAKRRPGTKYLQTIPNQITRVTAGITISTPNGGTGANANDDDTATEVVTTSGIGTTDPYVVVHYDLGSAKTIQFADVEGLRVDTGNGVADEFFIQHSQNDSTWTSLGDPIPVDTSDHNRRRTGPISARYWRVARIGTTDLTTAVANLDEFTLWEMGATLSTSRLVDFKFSNVQRYMLVYTDRNLSVWRNGVKQVDVRTPYEDTQLARMNWTQELDILISFHKDVATSKLVRQGDHDEWQYETIAFDAVPRFAFTPVFSNPAGTATPSAVEGAITITLSSTVADSTWPGQFIEGNGGRARILAFVSSTSVKAVTIIPFLDTNAIANNAWEFQSGYEDAWSAARGYPQCGTFHEGRLFVGGTDQIPNGLWGSRSGQFFNFDIGQNLDDEAIDVLLRSTAAGDVPEILNLVSGRHLQVFASSAEFYAPQRDDTPLTPSNIRVRSTTSRGSEPGLRPQEISGATLFVQREGKAVREFLFSDVEVAYTSENISLLSSHLINRPIDIAFRKSISTNDADYLLVVNVNTGSSPRKETDGTLAILTTLRDQDITAWTLQETDGDYLQVGVDDTEMYCIVERNVNASLVRFFEQFDLQDTAIDDQGLVDAGIRQTFNPMNAFTRSEEFDHADWTKANVTVTPNATTDPENTAISPSSLADELVENTVDGEHTISMSASVGAAEDQTISIYAKKNARDRFWIEVSTGEIVYFDLTNCLIGTQASGGAGTIKALSDDWVRCSLHYKTTASGTPTVKFGITLADNSKTYAGDGSSSLYVWGAQWNKGPRTFEYFQTTSTAEAGSSLTITGLDHLEGKTVEVIRDGFVEAQKVVASGQITGDAFAEKERQVGLPFLVNDSPNSDDHVWIQTMPVVGELPSGSTIDKKKKITRTLLQLYETRSVVLDNTIAKFLQFGLAGDTSPLDVPVQKFTGRKIFGGKLGWSDEAQINVTQNQPTSLTLLGIQNNVRF